MKHSSASFLVKTVVATIGMVCAVGVNAQRVWGINGHPDENEYLVWNRPEEARRQFGYLDELGVTHYRVSFSESKNDPRILCHLLEPMRGRPRKIEVIPVVFAEVVPSAGYQSNYDAGYAQGKKWAEYSLKNGYLIRYWELGNETSLAKYRDIPLFVLKPGGDATNPDHWADNVQQGMNGAIESMAGMLRGLYWGLKDAHGRQGVSTQILFGDTWMNFGYVRKLMRVRMSTGPGFLPADILSSRVRHQRA